MPEESKSLSQTYHETVEALKAQGVKNADAVREVAKKHGKSENAIRGGIHQYKSRHLTSGSSAGPRRGRRSNTTVEDFVANARVELQKALALIDREVEQAKLALENAQSHYDQAVTAVKDRKTDIEQKLKGLS